MTTITIRGRHTPHAMPNNPMEPGRRLPFEEFAATFGVLGRIRTFSPQVPQFRCEILAQFPSAHATCTLAGTFVMHLRRVRVRATTGAYMTYLAVAQSLWYSSGAKPCNIINLGPANKVHLASAKELTGLVSQISSDAFKETTSEGSLWREVWHRFLRLEFSEREDLIRTWVARGPKRKPMSAPTLKKIVAQAQVRRTELVPELINQLVGWEMTVEALSAELEVPKRVTLSLLNWLDERGAPMAVSTSRGEQYWTWATGRKPQPSEVRRWSQPE